MTEDELIACPNSAEHQSLSDDYKLHYATRGELKEHGGVCASCYQKFRKHNVGAVAGRRETPSEFHRQQSRGIDQHIGFGDDHEILGVEDFNYDEVDRLAGEINEEPVQIREMIADMLARILVACWSSPRGIPASPRLALQKFALLCSGIRPDITRRNFTEVAKHLGITKQATSKNAIRLQEVLKFKFAATRSMDSRAAMSRAQLRLKAKHPTPGKESFEPTPTNRSDRTPSFPYA